MKFESERFYHIYNRGNNSQPIFFEEDNYLFFLKKIRNQLRPLVEILAYCLMPNHFHFLIYTADLAYSPGDLKSPGEYSKKITDAIAIILRSYTRAINKRQSRTGSLFQQSTQAKILERKDYPFTCFHYIHQNPVKSKLVQNHEDWAFSSYQDYAGLRGGTLCNKVLANELLEIPLNHKEFIEQSETVSIFDEFNPFTG